MGITLFDWIAGGVFLLSGLVGFARGATREVTTVVAFVVAAVLAVFSLRFSGPIFRQAIDIPWLANATAILVVFIAVYILLRLIGGALTRGVRQTALSGADRVLGFAIGLVRGLVVVGLFTLLIDATTPVERVPGWIKDARAYPLAAAAGAGLRAFAPKGLQAARDVAPAMETAVAGPPPDETPAPAPRKRRGGYSADQRGALDDLVEKTR